MVSCSCYIFANLYASVIPFDKEEYRYLIVNFPDHIILYIPNVICACTYKKKASTSPNSLLWMSCELGVPTIFLHILLSHLGNSCIFSSGYWK